MVILEQPKLLIRVHTSEDVHNYSSQAITQKP